MGNSVRDMETQEAGQLLVYWQSLQSDRQVPPRREDFDPAAIKDILPLILLLERTRPDYLEIRLMGMRAQNRMGGNYTGEDFIGLFKPALRPSRRAIFDAVIDRPAILHFTNTVGMRSGATIPSEGLFMPLRRDGEVRQIVGLNVRRQPLDYRERLREDDPVVDVSERGRYSMIDLDGQIRQFDADRTDVADILTPI